MEKTPMRLIGKAPDITTVRFPAGGEWDVQPMNWEEDDEVRTTLGAGYTGAAYLRAVFMRCVKAVRGFGHAETGQPAKWPEDANSIIASLSRNEAMQAQDACLSYARTAEADLGNSP